MKLTYVKLVVVNLYRPPSGSITIAIDKLNSIIESIKNDYCNHDFFLVGDLNINLLTPNSYSKLFLDLCATYTLYNYVNVPTRVTPSNATLLDICTSNCKHIIASGVVTYGLSDHYLLYCIKKRERNDSNISRAKIKVRSFKDYDVDSMKNSLRLYNWGRYYATRNVNTCWSMLYEQILIHADFFAPFCTKFVRTSQPGWFSTEILEKSIDRDRLYGIAKRSKIESDFLKAKAKRNTIKIDIQNARSSYYLDRLARFSGVSKRFWNEVNTLISPVNLQKINCIYDLSLGKLVDSQASAGHVLVVLVCLWFQI